MSAWLELAAAVHKFASQPAFMARFRERVKEAAAEWLRQFDAKRQREEARSEVVRREGVPHGAGHLPPDPRDGSFHWLESVSDAGPANERVVLEAWLPAELSPDLDPDDTLSLPVPDRPVSLAEKCAALLAIYDAHWRGEKKIGPMSDDLADREAGWHFLLVRAAAKLDPASVPVILPWIAEVEADLRTEKAAVTARRQRRDTGSQFEAPNLFRWGGREFQLPPIPWRLLEYLFHRQRAQEDDVAEHVWDTEAGRVSQSAIKSAINDLNKRLAEQNIPVTVSRKGGYIILKIDHE